MLFVRARGPPGAPEHQAPNRRDDHRGTESVGARDHRPLLPEASPSLPASALLSAPCPRAHQSRSGSSVDHRGRARAARFLHASEHHLRWLARSAVPHLPHVLGRARSRRAVFFRHASLHHRQSRAIGCPQPAHVRSRYSAALNDDASPDRGSTANRGVSLPMRTIRVTSTSSGPSCPRVHG